MIVRLESCPTTMAEAAKLAREGCPSGTAIVAEEQTAGYGRHGILHEQHFFELAGDLTVEVEFLLSDEEAEKLIELIKREQIRVFYAKVPVEFGMIDGKD